MLLAVKRRTTLGGVLLRGATRRVDPREASVGVGSLSDGLSELATEAV